MGIRVGIIGYGRFGRFWEGVLAPSYDVWVTDRQPVEAANYLPLADLCAHCEAIFLCVPINQIEAVIDQIAPHLRPGQTVLDTCSVKVLPARAMLSRLGESGANLIATHPMFGPDSASVSLSGLPVVVWPLAGEGEAYRQWARFFEGLGLRVVEMSPEEHDRLAAYSQGVTHYMGRVLDEMALQPTPIDTRGFSILLSLVEQTCNDSWELFHDLQIHNPYTREMRLRLEKALNRVYAALLPSRVSPDALIIGIQGGQGSFNEEACRHYCAQHADQIGDYRIEYLYTTENVLRGLHEGEIDFGVFAVQNARGGVVMETIHALSRYRCQIVELFDIVISHCILHHPQIEFGQITTLISHPQALAQCADTLAQEYAHLKLESGEGDLIDQALCAKHIRSGELPRTYAVLAPKVCAQLYGLRLHAEGLQDLKDENLTTFAWARRG